MKEKEKGDRMNDMKKIERLLRGGSVPASKHKMLLREKLFGQDRELAPDELEGVSGGVTLPEPDGFDQWETWEPFPMNIHQ